MSGRAPSPETSRTHAAGSTSPRSSARRRRSRSSIPTTGVVEKRIELAPGSRPHHVHRSTRGDLVAFGLYGTDKVAVVDTDDRIAARPVGHRSEAARAAAITPAVFSRDGKTLYVASDATSQVIALEPRTGEVLWRMDVPGAHELAVSRDGKTAFVTRRTLNRVSVIDLKQRTYTDVLTLGLPDTMRLAAGGKLLTIGLRTTPAQVAVVDTRTFEYELVRIGPMLDTTTVAGHQWTSPNGRYTFAAYEGGTNPGIAVIDHRAGKRRRRHARLSRSPARRRSRSRPGRRRGPRGRGGRLIARASGATRRPGRGR